MTVEFKELCRVCLTKVKNMKYLIDSTTEIRNLISMLSSIINSEINITEGLPSYMCSICEEKLKTSFEFQQVCQKSHIAISEYIETPRNHISGTKPSLVSELTLQETVKKKPVGMIEEISVIFEENSDTKILIDKEVTKKTTKVKLKQHDAEEVMNVINEIKMKFYEAKECLFCTFTGMNNRTLSLHMTRNHGELKGSWCSQCNKIKENLSDHIKSVHQDELKCKFCCKKSRSSSHLVEHLLYHSVDQQFTCHICNKSFISARSLKHHSKIHQIHICFKETRNKKNCQRKIPEDKFCADCSENGNRIKVHDKEDEIKGLCIYCGKQFKNQSYLSVHLRRHTKETPYKCRYCDVATVTKAHLQEHERTHTGEKPYVCKFCGKAFIQRSILSTHLKIHTGRTEQCNLCSKKFCRPSELRNHMRKHTGEKPYACSYCERTFIQRSHLTEHLKIHTDDRPFKCHLCDKAFKQSGTLKGHINIHEGKNVYKCGICSYTCRKSYTLTLHVRQHQNISNPETYKCNICEEMFLGEEALMEHRNSTIHDSKEIVHENV